MTYLNLGECALDYYPCRYGKSKLLFRGPRREMTGDFIAMIGSTETYGKFIEKPFSVLVEHAIGMETVNFGCVNAGVDVFINEPSVLEACGNARVTVIQALGAQNMTNRFYAVHPRRNDRFLRASALLKTIYSEVDFAEFSFTKHLMNALQAISPERFSVVQGELRAAWVARTKLLINKIEGKTILLWFSDRSPDSPPLPNGLGRDPLFVDRSMVEEIRPHVSAVVEVVPDALTLARGTEGMIYSPLDELAARELMGVGAHEQVAAALVGPLKHLL